jgi:uncharacterized protein YdaU (DUF1376 family)
MIGLTAAEWIRLTEDLPADARGYLLDLLIWTWSHKAPLPSSEPARMRIARCGDRKRWRVAWALLQPLWTDAGEFPAQQEARRLREVKAAAGKASAAARAARQGVQQPVQQPAQHRVRAVREIPVEHGVRPGPVEKPVENPLNPVENGGSPVEIGPPIPPSLVQRSQYYRDPDSDPAAGAAVLPPEKTLTKEDAAVKVIVRVLRRSGQALAFDDFRDAVYGAALEIWPRGGEDPPGGSIDEILSLAYSRDFWRTREELLVRAATIELAGHMKGDR